MRTAEEVAEEALAAGATELTSSACAACGTTSEELKRCSGCSLVWYCSSECQRSNWSQHRTLCKSSLSKKSNEVPHGQKSRPWKQTPVEPEEGESLTGIGPGVGADGTVMPGASVTATSILQRDPELQAVASSMGISQFYTNPLKEDSDIVAMTSKRLASMRAPAAGRIQYAQQLFNGLGALPVLLASQRLAGEQRRASARKTRPPDTAGFLRRATVIIESNEAYVEDLMGSGALPRGSVVLFFCPRAMLRQYVVERMKEMDKTLPKSKDRIDPMTLSKGLEKVVDKTPAGHLPVVVAYRHKEDETGFAFTIMCPEYVDHGGMLAMGCPTDEGGAMNDVNLISISFPSLGVVCYDADQSNFRFIVDMEPAPTSDSAEDVLIEAVSLLKLATPAMTAKEVHAALVQQTQWADLSVSQVKKACSKAGKRNAPKPEAMPAQSSGPSRQAFQKSANAMFDALEDGHFTEGGQNTWKKSIQQKGIGDRSWQHSGLDKAAMQRFIMAYAPIINGFAANRFAELGKGACFLFSRTCIFLLYDLDPKDPSNPVGPLNAWQFDRQFVLVWGTEKRVRGPRKTFTAAELSSTFPEKVQTLPKLVASCDKTTFPLIYCCDPHGTKLPSWLSESVRPMKCPPDMMEVVPTDIQTACCAVPFFDFEEMLAGGKDFGYRAQDVVGINMDRDCDDPNTR